MLKGFFDIDKPFWQWFCKIPEVVALSILWILCCLPVVTILPASIALYDAIARGVMNGAGGYFRRFFSTLWNELKRGILLTLLWGALLLMILYGETMLYSMAEVQPEAGYLLPVFMGLYLIYFGVLGWLIPLESRYHFRFWQLQGYAYRFFLGRLPYSALMLVISVAGVILCLLWPLLVIIIPGVIAMLHCIFVEKVFKKQFPDDYPADEVYPPGPPENDPAKPLPTPTEE